MNVVDSELDVTKLKNLNFTVIPTIKSPIFSDACVDNVLSVCNGAVDTPSQILHDKAVQYVY